LNGATAYKVLGALHPLRVGALHPLRVGALHPLRVGALHPLRVGALHPLRVGALHPPQSAHTPTGVCLASFFFKRRRLNPLKFIL